jgi:hypothetical protein
MKFQTPSTKFQISTNVQNSNDQMEKFGDLDIGIWDLFVVWILEFGI